MATTHKNGPQQSTGSNLPRVSGMKTHGNFLNAQGVPKEQVKMGDTIAKVHSQTKAVHGNSSSPKRNRT